MLLTWHNSPQLSICFQRVKELRSLFPLGPDTPWQVTLNQRVHGSSPCAPTNKIKGLDDISSHIS